LKPTVIQVENAARAWLDSMRRTFAIAFPDAPNPVRAWDEYQPADRQHLLTAARAALSVASQE